MKRCALPTSLHLRAPLPRPPSFHSRLPRHVRSFTFASRLARDHPVEPAARVHPSETGDTAQPEPKHEAENDDASLGSKQDGKPTAKKSGKKADAKDSKKPKHGKSGGEEDRDGEAQSGKEGGEGHKKPKKPRTKAARFKKVKGESPQDDPKNLSEKSSKKRSRRARSRLSPAAAAAAEKVQGIHGKMAQMRKELDELQGKAQNLQAGSGGKSLKEALLGASAALRSAKQAQDDNEPKRARKKITGDDFAKLDIKHLNPDELHFQPVDYEIPPVPRLSYGLDRVLFNPGVYRLQDPRTRVYNFDPYLEKIMSVNEFNFDALSEYKTSSKDEELLALTQKMGTRFTGSTSSMSGVLQHFHFLLSNFRDLNHEMLSNKFPKPTKTFSKITVGPSAIFLRRKDGIYAIDADKAYDSPNIMSWLGHSLEKLLTVDRQEFERYRRSSGDAVPGEDESSRCYHYSQLGNFLMRSQLDAYDPRLPGSGIFDLKTRAVVSIRMNHEEYESGKGYQIRYDLGEWESYEREFYDMTRATMLKYSLQVRMGRMDGIFVAYHNVERIFGFQYLPLEDMDNVLHGQKDTCLGDQEFKMSISLLDELMQKATEMYPEQTLHMHFHTHNSTRGNPPFMYIFAEPCTEEQADEIQNRGQAAQKAFERDIVGIKKDDPALQAEWHDIQDRVNEELEGEEEVGSEQTPVTEEESSEISDAADEASLGDNKASDAPAAPKGPLMGWTLAVRHRLNGNYVERPEHLTADDSWTIEYHIRELKEEDRWDLYEKVKLKRSQLIGEERKKALGNQSLQRYREVIQRYSDQGRRWREEQDELAAAVEPQVYEPLGPGSQNQATTSSG